MLQKRGKWLTGFMCLVGALHAQYAKAPDAYTVTQTNSMFGPSALTEISRDGNMAIIDRFSDDGKSKTVRTFYDLQNGKTYNLDLRQTPQTCNAGRFSGDWGDPFATTAELAQLKPKDIGTETVNGLPAKVIEVTIPGQAGPGKVWIDAKYGLVLKLDMGGKTVIETKKLSFAKPAASMTALPAVCSSIVLPPTEAERIAAETGGNAADFVNATTAPLTGNSCTVLFRVVRAGSMSPITSGFQVAVDKTVDVDHPASYQMGVGTDGHISYAGGGLKELTSQLQNGVLRIDGVGQYFDLETAFGNAGSSSTLIHRQCYSPQTVLLYVIKNPAKIGDGGDMLWVKSGKYATVPPR
ncbi:exported hypothetical protein [Candidatus Sulfopaludibacter sp. SbA3]|nr:exported hypothetical protein [Candidatus Sulfopaludibacter sp. SbA3]